MPSVTELTEESWEAALRGPQPLLAGFWAQWCLPSHALAPLLEGVSADFGSRMRVSLVDNDAAPRLSERYRIQGLPTLLLLQGGSEVERRVGLMDRAALHQWLDQRLGGAGLVDSRSPR